MRNDDDDALRPAQGFYNATLISILLWLMILCGVVAAIGA